LLVSIEDIKIASGRREVLPEDVKDLAQSIAGYMIFAIPLCM